LNKKCLNNFESRFLGVGFCVGIVVVIVVGGADDGCLVVVFAAEVADEHAPEEDTTFLGTVKNAPSYIIQINRLAKA
jgi:hypothetical protein